jgi:hypothetical protein
MIPKWVDKRKEKPIASQYFFAKPLGVVAINRKINYRIIYNDPEMG